MADTILCEGGIYVIRNTVNGKVYVGSSVNIARRWKTHKAHLRSSKHHSPTLQRSWNSHSESAFVFEIIERVERSADLVVREQYWLDKLQSFGENGYNSRPIAESTRGHRQSKEHIAKRVAKIIGRKKSPSEIAAMSERMRGKRLPAVSEDGKRRQIEALRNRVISEETRSKLRDAQTGKLTEKQRIASMLRAERSKGVPWSEARRQAYNARVRSDSGLKIKDADVPVILSLRDDGKSLREIAEKFGVTKQYVWQIASRKHPASRS